jgi:hypothetical protein
MDIMNIEYRIRYESMNVTTMHHMYIPLSLTTPAVLAALLAAPCCSCLITAWSEKVYSVNVTSTTRALPQLLGRCE